MQIILNTDHNIESGKVLTALVNGAAEGALGRFNDRINRVEVHLSDENSDKKKGKEEKRCVMEARLDGHQPLAASHTAGTVEQAVNGAADKLSRVLESTFGRIEHHRPRMGEEPV